MKKIPRTVVSWWHCFWSIWRHKWYFWRGARIVGGVPLHRILLHDMIKFHPKEFFGYANRFYGANDNPDLFDIAWLHHQNLSDHHWEYWIIRSAHKVQTIPFTVTPAGGFVIIVEMPRVCVREMVSDMLAAELSYTGKLDMAEYLQQNIRNFQLHPKASEYFVQILIKLGYKEAWKWLLKKE